MKNYLSRFVQARRQYRACSLYNKTLAKLFNKGMGCVDVIRFYPDMKKICVAENFMNRIDWKNLDIIRNELRIDDWEIVNVKYSPWTHQCLGLHLYQNPVTL